MAFAWRRRAPRAKLPPVERATRKVCRWKWVQTGALVLNLVIMAALAGLMTSRDISVAGGVVVPIIMAGVAFIVTGLVNWLGRYVGGYRHRWYICMVIFADIACIGTQIAALIVLTVARLPAHCTGLTSISSRSDNKPERGYDTIGFGKPGERGELDGYCPAPRVSWLISLLLIIFYFVTIGWAIRLMIALKRSRKQQNEMEIQPSFPQQESEAAPPSPAHPMPRYHINVPVIPRSDISNSRMSSVSLDYRTPVASPPPYWDDGVGTFTKDKKEVLRKGG